MRGLSVRNFPSTTISPRGPTFTPTSSTFSPAVTGRRPVATSSRCGAGGAGIAMLVCCTTTAAVAGGGLAPAGGILRSPLRITAPPAHPRRGDLLRRGRRLLPGGRRRLAQARAEAGGKADFLLDLDPTEPRQAIAAFRTSTGAPPPPTVSTGALDLAQPFAVSAL